MDTVESAPDLLELEKQNRIDVSLLEHNVSLTYEQRLFEHQQALNLYLEIQKAGQLLYARSQSAHKTSSHE